MFILLYVGKRFGMSSNLKTFCTVCGAGRTSDFFRFDWKAERWNLLVVVGAIIGGFLAANFLSVDQIPNLNPQTIEKLHNSGFEVQDKPMSQPNCTVTMLCRPEKYLPCC
jgi:hypothetical protein